MFDTLMIETPPAAATLQARGDATLPGSPAVFAALTVDGVAVAGLDQDGLLTRAEVLRAAADAAETQLLMVAARWAHLHGPDATRSRDDVVLPGLATMVGVGGDGTPEVDEYAWAELGCVLELSDGATISLLADALDLHHRLPRLWTLITTGGLRPWMGRRIAHATRPLTAAQATVVDATLARWAGRVSFGRLIAIVAAAVTAAAPATTRADQDWDGDRHHGAWLLAPKPGDDPAERVMFIRGETGDLLRFDAAVDRVADAMRLLGAAHSKDRLRARAVGTLASPQQCLDLYQAAADTAGMIPADQWPQDVTAEPDDDVVAFDDDRAHGGGIGPAVDNGRDAEGVGPAVDNGRDREDASGDRDAAPVVPRRSGRRVDPRPRTVLYVHLAADTLIGTASDATAGGHGGGGHDYGCGGGCDGRGCGGGGVDRAHPVARVDQIGPVLVDTVQRWLIGTTVIVKPVIDLAGITPVDAYEIPDRLREAVRLVMPASAFPWSGPLPASHDVDHTLAYRPIENGGPPGQTGIGNLAPLTRRQHRLKTHAGWQVKQPFPGVFIWRSPHGRTWLVDPTGTRRLQ